MTDIGDLFVGKGQACSRIRNCLSNANIHSLDDLRSLTRAELLNLANLGPVCLSVVLAMLEARGESLAVSSTRQFTHDRWPKLIARTT